MLVPFTKAVNGPGGEDDVNSDDKISDDEESDDKEVEGGREEFDEAAVEDTMKEVTEQFNVSEEQARSVRSSLTKVRICVNK